ncbi:TPA: AAA family ATPase [Vibrio harveyi]
MSYLTIVTPVSSFCGKVFKRNEKGEICKSDRAIAPAKSWAQTVACESLDRLAEIINSLSEGQAIILGYVPETVGVERFHLWSVTQMISSFEEFGELSEKEQEVERSKWIITKNNEMYLPRKKHLFERAPFFCLDRDIDDNAPEHIKAVQSLNNNEFLRVICEEISGDVGAAFYGADFLPVVSSSSQVFTDDGVPYAKSPSAHLYFQVESADDIDRFATALFAHSMASGYSYNKEINRKDSVNAFRKQTIFDPSVFTNGRLFFESSPRVGLGLKINKSDAVTLKWQGKKVDTSLVIDPNSVMLKKLEEQGIHFKNSRMGSHLSTEGLYHDMVIETQQHGAMTVSQYKNSSLGKLRCQTPFRDSSSWAAYLNKHDDGEPYLWDEGSRTKYREVKDDEELAHVYQMAMNAVRKELHVELPQHEEVEEVNDLDSYVNELEQDLAALVDFHEDDYSNVVAINDQFNVEEIVKPKPRESVFEFYDGEKFSTMQLREPEEMYIWADGALVKGGLTLFGGVPKVGKSSLLMSMLMSAACGGTFLGYPFDEPHKVLWFQGELMPEMLKGRYDEAIKYFTPVEQALIRKNLIMTKNGAKQLNGADRADYKRAVEYFKPSIVAIDPLRNLANIGNESDATEMIAALTALKETATDINGDISVILVHHLRKISQQSKGDPFDLFSGSGALRGYYDSGLVMLQDEQLSHNRELHWEIRNGKPLDKMNVSHIEGKWSKNGGLIEDVKQKTKSDLGTPEGIFTNALISLLKSDKNIGIENAVDWAVTRGKLNLVMQGRNVEMAEKTMDRHARATKDVHFTNIGRGRKSKIYYDGSKK